MKKVLGLVRGLRRDEDGATLVEYTILLWLKRKELSVLEICLTAVAGIAIAGGVYGEYLFGSRASHNASTLATISDNRIMDARERSANIEHENLTLKLVS